MTNTVPAGIPPEPVTVIEKVTVLPAIAGDPLVAITVEVVA